MEIPWVDSPTGEAEASMKLLMATTAASTVVECMLELWFGGEELVL